MRRLAFVFAVLFAAVSAPAQSALVERYEARVFEDASGLRLPYRLFRPAGYDPSKRYPLVVYLHGGAGAGTDNRKHLAGGNARALTAFVGDAVQAEHPAFVLAPQTSRGGDEGGWGGFDRPIRAEWDRTKVFVKYLPDLDDEPIDAVVRLIATLEREFSLDSARFYVTGQSRGGYGTWGIVSRYPDLFAAAAPLCGGGDPSVAARIRTPIWAFHGDADETVAVEQSRAMIAALRAAGRSPRFTEYPGAGHGISGLVYADRDLIDWLFSRRKR